MHMYFASHITLSLYCRRDGYNTPWAASDGDVCPWNTYSISQAKYSQEKAYRVRSNNALPNIYLSSNTFTPLTTPFSLLILITYIEIILY